MTDLPIVKRLNARSLVHTEFEDRKLDARAAAAIKTLYEALEVGEELYLQANDGAWKNGVTDPSGSSDEGEYLAASAYYKIRGALNKVRAMK